MERIEKTVFICYRRTNVPWALAIFQNLTQYGFDVFFDFNGVASGDFEKVILGNIKSRAHFLILLAPSTLERSDLPGDWVRREIETAIASDRNIVPIMLEGFSFSTPAIADKLTGTLAPVKNYNALSVPSDYFLEAMRRLRDRFLSIPLTAVIHPASTSAQLAAAAQSGAAQAAPLVQEQELTAQQYLERGNASLDIDEQIRFYTEAIRLQPDYALAYSNRGVSYKHKRDLDASIRDYDEAVRLDPNRGRSYYDRGAARNEKGDADGALSDYTEAIRLNPDYSTAYYNRGNVREAKGDVDGALADYRKYLETGGGELEGDTEEVEGWICKLQEKLEKKAPKS